MIIMRKSQLIKSKGPVTMDKKIIKLLVLHLVMALAFSAVPFTPAYASDGVSAAAGFADDILNGLENLVHKSGLIDLKYKIKEQYGLLVKPFLKTGYDYSSNVFKANSVNSAGDNIWTVTPGVQFKYKNEQATIGGAYEAPFRWLANYSEQNTQTQRFMVYANLEPSDDFYINIGERFASEESISGSSTSEPVAFLDNTVNVTLGYRADEDYTYEVGYELFDRNFRSTAADIYSYSVNKFSPRVYRKVEGGKVYTGVDVGIVNFNKTDSRDTVYTEIPVGYQGELPFWGLIGDVKVGYHNRSLQGHAGRNDWRNIVTNLAVQKRLNGDKTVVSAGFTRQPVESSFATATTYDEKSFFGSVKHLITPKLRGRASVRFANEDYYDGTAVGSRIAVAGTNVIIVVPGGIVKRDDDVFNYNLGLDYNVRKWLILHADYQFTRRNSNISALDYTDNTISLGSTIPL